VQKSPMYCPLQGTQAGLQLFVMMDNSGELSYGTQAEDIRHFILAQPPTTKIGIVYMDMQGPKIVQDLTANHALAARAVTTPLGRLANGQSPYASLSQLIDKWPPSSDRREVLMISNGEDAAFAGFGPNTQNPNVDVAIEKAQRAGVVVFTMATSNGTVRLPLDEPTDIPRTPNTLTDSGPRSAGLGKFYLGKVAEAAGGELYYYKSSAPASFAPYLADLTERLARQYRVSFLSKPGSKPSLQAVKVRCQIPHVKAMAAQRIYIPARQ
jgi:hypothetical protein